MNFSIDHPSFADNRPPVGGDKWRASKKDNRIDWNASPSVIGLLTVRLLERARKQAAADGFKSRGKSFEQATSVTVRNNVKL